ncbi:uncharacterized protein E0L32_002977 [Thyridium curvatum]|uniref:4-hydroxyacetophenone monooxygenase n=1 Tax=Thyridium curvatum TaxID=1093900 RepID=A0A507BEX7_9PEZI|nr:uncharacterized protein E0L32_002977 [Thyridium curvatum]TPX17876.1 hypothetical protein E0L32_002977 [Thyridium curvatum]
MGSVPVSSPGTSTPTPVTEEFIRKAIDKSNLNALRLALLQVTGDPELAKMRTRRHAIRGGAMYAQVLAEEDAPALKEKAFAFLSKRKPSDPIPSPPSREEVKKLVNVFGDEPIPETELEYEFEELAFAEFPRRADWSDKKPAPEKIAKFKVIVVGAGISGIAAAIHLSRLGINFEVLERQHDIGGTWLLNSYPDARVDVSSFLFQFKCVKNYHWSEYFASAGETQKYLDFIVEKFKLREHFLFNRELTRCVWHEDQGEWELSIKRSNGGTETMRCNAIISGSGLFATPNLPDIKGIKDFEGPVFHTARWDHKVDYTDKRVALLGTGSTGTQLASAVAQKAKTLTVYQRTPNWIMSMDGYRVTIDDEVRYVFDNMPYYWNWFCYSQHRTTQQLQYMQDYDREWQAKGGVINERNDLVHKALLKYIEQKSEGIPGLKEKLTPKYAPLVRRLVVDNGFYDTLRRDNVELVTDEIDGFTQKGIKTKDGKERPFDLVVLGTGFKVSKYFWPCEYVGRNGVTMEQLWKKDGPRSYLGLTIPGFPNFFILYGPNHQPRAGAFYSWSEIWMRYIGEMIVHLLENDKKSIDCRKDVFDEYNLRLDEANKGLIWESEGSSYYVNEHGRQSVNTPWYTSDYHRMIFKPNFEDFEIR